MPYNFKDKTHAGLQYEIFCPRESLLYGRVEFSPNQWDAVCWNKDTGVCVGENASNDYNLVVNKFLDHAQYLQNDTISGVDTFVHHYQNLKDNSQKQKECFAKVQRHNHRVRAENSYYKTVKELKDALKDVPDDYILAYQRVEDMYFKEGSGWQENNFILPFNEKDDWGTFLKVWHCGRRDQEKVFVFEAHY